jgi:hypothetical protein
MKLVVSPMSAEIEDYRRRGVEKIDVFGKKIQGPPYKFTNGLEEH